MFTRDLKVTINMDEVMHRIDCHKDSDIYEEIVEEYREIEAEMYALCEPVFLLEYGEIGPELAVEGIPEGTPVLMALFSIGGKLSQYSTKAFAEGDYVKGMMADAIADTALFSLKKEIVPYLKAACGELQMGISRRLEPPHDIPIQAQKVIWEKTKAQETCGIGITSGFMLDPVKSHAEIYVLSEDKELFFHQHNCRNCSNVNCSGRNIPEIPVKVYDGQKVFTLQVKDGQSILSALMEADDSYTAVCGGRGRCGKCKIKVLEGYLPITASDKECFRESELKMGMRLSCKAFPGEPLRVEINFKREADFQVLTEYVESVGVEPSGSNRQQPIPGGAAQAEHVDCSYEQYGIAIDIGTTTIAVQLLSLENGALINTYSGINHQRSFGADVISRIKASAEGKKEALRTSIQHDLMQGIRQVLTQAGAAALADVHGSEASAYTEKIANRVQEIVIAGNTTMIHLLMGYDCKSLGEYPFTPVNINPIESTYAEIFGDKFLDARVRIIPGISTFVGSDITAGLYCCDLDEQETYSMLIDLGTNGEMALGNKDKMIVTSTAAGPAFEGGNIEWGVGSLEGAIAGVKIVDGKAQVRTIGDKAPIGICGTGVIETVAELIKAELVDETGCLDDDYFDHGYLLAVTEDGEEIVFTQQDVREIQLAKAAVRAGIETLFLRYGITKEQVEHVYLAGGFGFKLDCEKAIEIGMIPVEFADKVEAVGNSALGGAIKCLLSEEGWKRMERIGRESEEINLSADKDFNQFYMDYMYLEQDEM